MPNSYFRYFGHFWSFPSKKTNPFCRDYNVYLHACRNYIVYLHAIKRNPFLTSFLRYCKDIANLLFWVLWECLVMPINNDSITLWENLMPKILKLTCGKLWCLSSCKKINFISDFFLRYCQNIANLLFWELRDCLTIPIKNHSINK